MAPEANEAQNERNDERSRNEAVLRKLDRSGNALNETQPSNRVRVMKFGGSVLVSAENILLAARHVAEAAQNERIALTKLVAICGVAARRSRPSRMACVSISTSGVSPPVAITRRKTFSR